ncbi:14049_t:CDS:2, partial [Funneliformis geosporum]
MDNVMILVKAASSEVDKIIEVYDNALYNKRICWVLLNKAQTAETIIKNNYEEKNLFSEDNLQNLVVNLRKIQKFVKEISQLKSSKYNKNIEKDAKDLINETDSIIRDLQFSLMMMDFNICADDDNKDIASEFDDSFKFLQEIDGVITDANKNISEVFENINVLNYTLQLFEKTMNGGSANGVQATPFKKNSVNKSNRMMDTTTEIIEPTSTVKTPSKVAEMTNEFNERGSTDDIQAETKFEISNSIVSEAVSPFKIPFLSFLPIISDLTKLISEIVEVNQKAEHNKDICKMMLDKVQISDTSIRRLSNSG